MSRLILLSLSLLASLPAFSANLLTDPNFEAGGAAWALDAPALVVNNPAACAGTFCGQFTGAQLGVISQFVTTVPGQIYHVSFLLKNVANPLVGPDNQFHFQWGNIIPIATEVNDFGGFDWALLTVDVVADSNSTWVSFQGLSNSSTFYLDHIIVDGPDGSVPEPASIALSLAGLTAILAARARRR